MAGLNKSALPENMKWIATDEVTGVWEFLKAVDWTEPWLLCLIGFHFLVLLCAVLTRKYSNFQAAFFLFLLGLAISTEYLNKLGAKHWRMFSREQYFDSSGLFIMVVFAGPLLLNCFVMMVMWTCTAARMLIVVKRGQYKEQLKQQSKKKAKKE